MGPMSPIESISYHKYRLNPSLLSSILMMATIWWSLAVPLLLGAAQGDVPAKWKVVPSKEGRFRVAMPNTPTQTKKTVKTATGELTVTILAAEGRNDSLFVVSYSDIPEADLKQGSLAKRLAQARDGAVSNVGGKLREEKTIALDGHPGRQIVIEKDGSVIAKMRIFLVKRRLYQVMVLGSASVFSSKEVEMFLDSFRLNK